MALLTFVLEQSRVCTRESDWDLEYVPSVHVDSSGHSPGCEPISRAKPWGAPGVSFG